MRKIAITVIASLALPISAANADGIRSPLGISQAEWNASPAYQNFQCPAGTSRGEGVDMNFTTNRSDDFYFVTCNPIQEVIIPKGSLLNPSIPTTVTPIEVAPNDTVTVTTPAPQPVQESTPTPAPAPVITDTSTASTAPSTSTPVITPTSILDEELDLTWDWEKVLAWIVAWFDKWWRL